MFFDLELSDSEPLQDQPREPPPRSKITTGHQLIYRIEDANQKGAFHYLACVHDQYAEVTAYSHPAPGSWKERNTDIYRGYPHNYRFGCRSIPQLRMWFRSAKGRQAMAEQGGVMVTYSVPSPCVIHGRYQVVFNPRQATKISTVRADQW